MWNILLDYYVEIITIFLQGCENLRVHSNIFASTSKHFLKDMDKIHLKMPICTTKNLTYSDYLVPLLNIFCILTKYLSIGLDLNNKFKIYSKKPKWRKTHFVIYLAKINIIAGGAKSLLLWSLVDFSWNIWTKYSKKSHYWRLFGKLCYHQQYFKTFFTGCKKVCYCKYN